MIRNSKQQFCPTHTKIHMFQRPIKSSNRFPTNPPAKNKPRNPVDTYAE